MIKVKRSLGVLIAGSALILSFLWFLSADGKTATAAPSQVITVCLPAGCDYTDLQAAVSAAEEGDLIKVAAGVYVGVQHLAELDTADLTAVQVVAITRTLTIRGGYTTTDQLADPPDPAANPTLVDAENLGRGFYIVGDISPVIEGIRVTRGDASGLGGGSWSPQGALDGGGGLYIQDASPVLSSLWVYSNTAQEGAGLRLAGSSAVMDDLKVMTNTAEAYGAGLYLFNSPVSLSGSDILNNKATGDGSAGGGAYLQLSHATLIDNLFSHNSAIQFGGGLVSSSSDPVLLNNTVTSNESVMSNGGGIYMSSANHATLDGNTVSHNSCRYDGGGLLLIWSNDLSLTGNTISANESGRSGGGVGVRVSDGVWTNNIIADNQAGLSHSAGVGAGLYAQGATLNLRHTTLAQNTGRYDVGIYLVDYELVETLYTGTLYLTNTIIASQAVGISVTHQVSSAHGSVLLVDGVLWYDTPLTVTHQPTATVAIQGEHMGDPAFAGPTYRIGPGSAAINLGVPAGVARDIDLEPRVGLPDLGADEYWAPGTLRQVFLPLVSSQ